MFTGLIEEIGSIKRIERSGTGLDLCIQCSLILEDMQIGDSIAINGVCQTVTQYILESFSVFVSRTTCEITTLKLLQPGDQVNLERAMQVGKRFGGHIVQGHIDGIGTVIELKKDRSGQSITVRVKEDLIRYITPKGSITINGVSLTVVDVIAGNVVLYVIPETIRQTILFEIRVGDMVNIEVDILAKYTESILSARDSSTENHDTLKQKLYNEGFL